MNLQLLDNKAGHNKYLKLILPTPMGNDELIAQIPLSQTSYTEIMQNIKVANFLSGKHNGEDCIVLEKSETKRFDILTIKTVEK